jgi:hypothetical protein
MKLLLLLGAMWAQQADWAAINAERDPEKKYARALDFAAGQIDAARKRYEHGEMDAFRSSLGEIKDSVVLCDVTLRATGRNPSKSPKHFKRAELKIREMLKRLNSFAQEVSVDDREAVTAVVQSINKIHEELLLDIMGRRK